MNTELMESLRSILGEKYVLEGEAVGADYGHDELAGGAAHMPAAVVQAGSTEEVSAVLRLCSAAGVPVTPRGAGTGLAGGSVPLSGGVVLSLGRMNRVLGFDEDSLSLRVQPGVLLSELKAEAESRGLRYPPDPGEKTATIGSPAPWWSCPPARCSRSAAPPGRTAPASTCCSSSSAPRARWEW